MKTARMHPVVQVAKVQISNALGVRIFALGLRIFALVLRIWFLLELGAEALKTHQDYEFCLNYSLLELYNSSSASVGRLDCRETSAASNCL